MGRRRTLLAKEQRRIRSEYEQRLQELERERHGVEEDRQQVRQGAGASGACGASSFEGQRLKP